VTADDEEVAEAFSWVDRRVVGADGRGSETVEAEEYLGSLDGLSCLCCEGELRVTALFGGGK